MTPSIEIERLSRSFADNHVLKEMNFSIDQGTITGLLGVNGSGKTTLMHCVMGMIKPQSGRCEIFGEQSWNASIEARQRIGFVPQSFDSFEWMTIKQVLAYTGVFYDQWQDKFVEQLIQRFDLDPGSQITSLSLGMKQRVSIVMALGHKPDLLVLDEPVAALDPVGRRAFIELLLDLHVNEGKTILFSTHITSDIERVAARVALLKDGDIAIHTNLEDLKMSYCRVHVHSQSGVADLVSEVPGCLKKEIQANSARLTLKNLDRQWHAQVAAKQDVQIEVEDLNLEEIFLELNS